MNPVSKPLVPVFIDWETFWSTTHTLSKMAPMEYVMHPETELISAAVKVKLSGPTVCTFGEDRLRELCEKADWSDKFVIGHNMSGFDALIMAHRLGIRPAMWGCTLAMARPKYAKTVGLSLGKLVQHFNIGTKNNAALIQTKGRHLKDFTATEVAEMSVYNKDDTDQCAMLFKRLMQEGFLKDELRVIDLTIRMRTEPQFMIDRPLLERTLAEARKQKHETLIFLARQFGLNVEADDEVLVAALTKVLNSATKFRAFLEARIGWCPMKKSPSTGLPVPALAKSDEAFLELLEHEDEVVALAAQARLDVKSTLLDTRIVAFLKTAGYCNGMLPVPLKYCGADTTGRFSGEDYNPQNLPRINPDKPKLTDALRMSLMAPPGKKVIVADLSGIELRVNHFLWKVPYSTQMWKEKADADLYRTAGALFYGCAFDDVTKVQRQGEKTKALGLGFGAGLVGYTNAAKTMGGLILDEEEAQKHIRDWRGMHPEIVKGWKRCQAALKDIVSGNEVPVDPWGMVMTCAEGLRLPSGRTIYYPELREEPELDENKQPTGRTEWWYGQGRHKARIYSGKIDENIVQAIARDIVVWHLLEYLRHPRIVAMGITVPALLVHDEIVFVVDEHHAEEALEILLDTMKMSPPWWPDIVLWAEGDIGERYGEAK